MFLRHALSIALLPFTVAVLVPLWIHRRYGTVIAAASSAPALLVQIAGVAVLAVGVVLFVLSLRRFARDGKGTLAPWDPPTRLVVRGPYRYVRNPMISGVLFVLIGEALVLRSLPHAAWAGIFLAANAVFIPWYEEPHLARVFGEPYRTYRAHVPRILPRLTPWQPPDDQSRGR